MVKLFPDQQAEFVAADPKTFAPVPGGWGRQGCTHVLLKSANKARVREAMGAAWERAAPKRVVKNATGRAKGLLAGENLPLNIERDPEREIG